ncbi:MAG: SGNH/GDSL hydrolase family protein [Acetobacteraceae bacterium]|nr:SGNH/GDSL hydrolase family protein [Acetobacteraceae bacterium]
MRRFLAAIALLTLFAGSAPAAELACPDIPVPPVSVPRLRALLDSDQDAVIVSLGSSSTRSYLASDRAHSYPAVLQARLNESLSFAHVAVINRGVGGQDAAEEVARMDADVLAMRPALVIWQVGANGVLHHTNPELFEELVEAGIRRLQHAKMDVVLMDNQRAPAILDAPGHAKLEQALADAVKKTGASLFSRERLMDDWQRAGYPYELFVGRDQLHHNDRGYDCVGRALAQAIVEGLGEFPPRAQATAALSRGPSDRYILRDERATGSIPALAIGP